MGNELLELANKIAKKRGELLYLISELDRLSGHKVTFYELSGAYNGLSPDDSYLVNAKHELSYAINTLMLGNENLYKGVKHFKEMAQYYNIIFKEQPKL